MATMVTIARTTRARLRLDRTLIDTVEGGGTSVDVEDPAIKRDLNRTVGRWVVLTDAIDDGTAIRNVINETGLAIPAGSLVAISGWDEATNAHNIVLADADGTGGVLSADGVVREEIADAAEGQMFGDFRLTAQNTNGLAVGDPVYLSTTAGGWTSTKPSGNDDVVQIVGHVAVVHAAAGVVEINVDKTLDKIGSDQLEADSVRAAALGVTAGTATASRAVVLNSDSHINTVKTAALHIGATGAEVNYTAAIQELAAKAIGTATFVVGAEAAEAVTVNIQLKDFAGADLAVRSVVKVYVSTDATGDAPGDGGATIALSAGTDGALISTDESGGTFVSEADGDLDVILTDSGAATQNLYLNLVTPLGEVITSGVIAFTA